MNYAFRCVILVLILACHGFALAQPEYPGADFQHEIWVATVQDTINPMVAEYLRDLISRGEKAGIECLIVELDTPGGVLESTHVIVKSEMNSRIPIVVYVSPSGGRAASAGMFITEAAHVAAMAPATNIGAAHPVTSGPASPIKQFKKFSSGKNGESDADGDEQFDEKHGSMLDGSAMEQKIMNDTLAWARGIAESRNRNKEWMKSAIVDSISSTEKEALEKGVVDLLAENRRELIEALDGRTVNVLGTEVLLHTQNARVVTMPMTFRQQLLSTLINPTIAIYLLMGGLLGLYIELTHPGFVLPGVAGAICLIMALFAMHALPINFAGLFLMLLAFGLFIAEVKVQSYGILTVGGIVSLLLGSSILFDSKLPGMEVSMNSILPLALGVAAVTVFLVSLVVKSHSRKTITGKSGMIGLQGETKTALNPSGKVFVRGELWTAETEDAGMLPEGERIEVVGTKNLTLVVRKINSQSGR